MRQMMIGLNVSWFIGDSCNGLPFMVKQQGKLSRRQKYDIKKSHFILLYRLPNGMKQGSTFHR